MKTLMLLCLLAVVVVGCNWQPTDQKICLNFVQYRIWHDQTGFWEEGKELRKVRDLQGKPVPCPESRP